MIICDSLIQDIRKEIRKIAAFLNKTITDEQLEKLVDHVRVDKFSKNESVNLTKEKLSLVSPMRRALVRPQRSGNTGIHLEFKNFDKLMSHHFMWLLNDRSNGRLEKSFQSGTQPENGRMDRKQSNGVRLEIRYRARQARLKSLS